ncbi:ABC transporter substrate-binding protein [Streptomyces sp. NPDC002523]
MNTSRLAGLAAALTSAALLSACGIGEADSPAPAAGTPSVTMSANADIAKLVPQEIKHRGYITVVTDVTYPPFGLLEKDGKTFAGIDVDMAKALEPLLGVDVRVVNAGFDAFIPGLQADRYDAGFNAITDLPDRRKVVDFIDFMQNGGVFVTAPSSTLKIKELTSVCEHSAGAEKGSDTVSLLQGLAPHCEAVGKKPVDVKIYGSQSDALVALTSGRVETVLAGSTAGYLAKESHGKYEVNGPLFPNLTGKFDLSGLALPKDSPLTEAMLAAVKHLYTDGTLEKIFTSYGLDADDLVEPAVNAA